MDSQDYAEILKARREKMMDYLRLKVEVGDWHGVADAAMDLRDIENELVGYLHGKHGRPRTD